MNQVAQVDLAYADRFRPTIPEARLYLAVLDEALATLEANEPTATQYALAYDWIVGLDVGTVTLADCAEIIATEPESIRDAVRRRFPAPVRRDPELPRPAAPERQKTPLGPSVAVLEAICALAGAVDRKGGRERRSPRRAGAPRDPDPLVRRGDRAGRPH